MVTNILFNFKSALSEPEQVAFARNVLIRLKGNPNFPTIQALLETELEPALDEFEATLQGAADGSRTKIAYKDAAQAPDQNTGKSRCSGGYDRRRR